MLKPLFCFLSLLVSSQNLFAYVPRANTIVEKMVLNNGNGEYKVVREVTLQAENREIKLREQWVIAYGDKMRLEVTSLDSSNPWGFAVLFDEKQRKTLSSNKTIKAFKKSREFFEPLFHDRSSRSLTRRLIEQGFVPEWIQNTPPPTVADGKTVMTPEPFVRLEPSQGSVNYALGSPGNQISNHNQPLIWVEQDSFLITKMRLGSRAEITNTGYQTFTGGLKLPSEQVISWGNNVAKIKLLAVERSQVPSKQWTLSPQGLGVIPAEPLVKEFYSRFR